MYELWCNNTRDTEVRRIPFFHNYEEDCFVVLWRIKSHDPDSPTNVYYSHNGGTVLQPFVDIPTASALENMRAVASMRRYDHQSTEAGTTTHVLATHHDLKNFDCEPREFATKADGRSGYVVEPCEWPTWRSSIERLAKKIRSRRTSTSSISNTSTATRTCCCRTGLRLWERAFGRVLLNIVRANTSSWRTT